MRRLGSTRRSCIATATHTVVNTIRKSGIPLLDYSYNDQDCSDHYYDQNDSKSWRHANATVKENHDFVDTASLSAKFQRCQFSSTTSIYLKLFVKVQLLLPGLI